jgi:hypothetical protein
MMGPGFKIFCDCGPEGALVERIAYKVNHSTHVPKFFGDRRGLPRVHNKCTHCGKLWQAPPERGPRAPKGQLEFSYAQVS